jgi:hypothetical protein
VLTEGTDAEDPLDIADVLAARWPIEIDPPGGRNRSWTVSLQAD